MKLEKRNIRNTSLSYLALRQVLGVLGLTLPLLIWVFNDFNLKSSISHFYYSTSSVIFTGYMVTFGIFLIFYPGRNDSTDKISDNIITTIGGVSALLTALVPTAYNLSCDASLDYQVTLANFCDITEISTPFFHNDKLYGFIHIASAVLFLVLMGYMSYSRFTKGNTSIRMKLFYKFCACMIWLSLLIAGVMFLKGDDSEYYIFFCECISIVFFGLAWLVKGKTFKYFGIY